MGWLIMLGEKDFTVTTSTGIPVCRKGYYTNANAISNLLRYITRTRQGEDRKDDLKGYGFYGASNYDPIEFSIYQFRTVQEIYSGDSGRRMYHFIYSFSDDELSQIGKDYILANRIAGVLAEMFWNMGHQVAYAVHDETAKRLHIHFAINSVNYISGLKFHINKAEIMRLSRDMASRVCEILPPRPRAEVLPFQCYCAMRNPASEAKNLADARRKLGVG